MLVLTAAFVLLAVEIAVLVLLLAPYVSVVSAPVIARGLRRLWVPLRAMFLILGFLLYEAYADMRRYQERAAGGITNMLDYSEALKLKFRAERNFYLYLFTTTLFLVIMRLEYLIRSRNALLQDQKKRGNTEKQGKGVEDRSGPAAVKGT